MSVKFFGQFLIERGEIDPDQLRGALALMKRENSTLGEIAIQEGFLSRADTHWVNMQQRLTDRPFGELAVELGHLTREQLERCVQRQDRARLRIGEALTRLGHLPADRLGALLDEFKIDQAPYETGQVELPEALAENRLAPYVVDLLPKFCMRIARVQVKIAPSASLRALPSYPYCVGVAALADPGLDVILAGDRDFALRIAAHTAGLDVDSVEEELIADGLGEFLNVLLGNAIGLLEREGAQAELQPARYRVESAEGTVFEVATSEGRAALLLAEI